MKNRVHENSPVFSTLEEQLRLFQVSLFSFSAGFFPFNTCPFTEA